MVQHDVRLEVGSSLGAPSFRPKHARYFIQLRLCRCVVIIVLPLKGLRELQVENWVLFALQQILIDFRARNLEHLHPINQVEHLHLFILFFSCLSVRLELIVHHVHGTSLLI